MQFDTAIRNLLSEIVAEQLGSISADPELITIDDAAALCGCDKSVITSLVHDRETNGFPAIVLGARTIRIDKRRLQFWFQQGGLTA